MTATPRTATGRTTTGRTLTDLLGAAEWDEPSLPDAVTAGWPAAERDGLVRAGVLAEGTPAAAAACDACGFDHVEPVQWVGGPGPDRRPFLACPHVGAVRFDPHTLRRWVVSLPGLARAVADALGASGGLVDRVPSRVWKIGTVRAGGAALPGVLAVGLARPDARAVVEQAAELRTGHAVVLVPATIPPPSLWGDARPAAVLPLGDVLSLGPDGLVPAWDVLASALAPAARPVAKGPARGFPTPAGATWEQVAVAVEDFRVVVRVGGVTRSFGFADAGFEDLRERGKPDEVWTLLATLARHRGVLGPADGIRTKDPILKQRVSRLRAALKALLGLDGDPFHPTRRGQPYRARFVVRAAGPATFPTPAGAGWDDLTLTEVAPGVLEVGVGAEERGTSFAPADDGAVGRWEGTTEAGALSRRCSLADVGLVGPAGTPDAAGATLVAVLRAGGRLTRPAEDPALLALGGVLTRFFGIGTPPFAFAPRRGEWVAQFEAASLVPPSDR